MDQAQQATAAEAAGRRLGALIRAARTAQGMTLADLGRRTGYSAGQVSRFERGVVQLIDILRRFADALDVAPQILGLALAGQQHPQPSPGGESVTPYADRGLVTRQQWNGTIRDAAAELWLYGMAEFGYATDDAVSGILARATARGCRVRILLLSPASRHSNGHGQAAVVRPYRYARISCGGFTGARRNVRRDTGNRRLSW